MRIQKTIGQYLTDRAPVTCRRGQTVAEAAAMMAEHSADCVLVVEGDRLVGIFTEWDFLDRVAAAGLDPSTTQLGQVMTADPSALSPEDCITYAINRMALGGYRNLPIVDESGVPVASLSVRDVITHLDEVIGELDGNDDGAGAWTDIGGGG